MKNLIKVAMASLLLFVTVYTLNAEETELKQFVYIPATENLDGYYIAKYPVTNDDYKIFLDENSSIRTPRYWKNGSYPKGKAKHPVVFVSYNDALTYCHWLEKKYPKYEFRLPTVKEWENAASGSSSSVYPWGNQIDENKLNYNKLVASVYLEENPEVTYCDKRSSQYGKKLKLSEVIDMKSKGPIRGWINHQDHSGFVYTDLFKKIMADGGYTTPVDQYPEGKSPYGVYDMSGNVWEWTSTKIIAQNGAERGQKVYAIKGGSWYANGNSCKITMRGEGRKPNIGYNTVGFRVIAEKIEK